MQSTPNRPDFMTAAKAALEKYYPDAVCAFIAGSIIRGTATKTSDIDITVIHNKGFTDIHRFSTVEQGWPIEFFVQNELANQYFMAKDRTRGMAVMMDMMTNGLVLPEENETSLRIRAAAKKLLEQGPPELTDDEIDDRRYFLTDTLDDLDDTRPQLENIGLAARLFDQLGDFYLRTQGQWSGHSKSLARLLAQNHPAFATKLQNACLAATQQNTLPLKQLVEEVLAPYGGPLFDGYKRTAPPDWRDFRKLYTK